LLRFVLVASPVQEARALLPSLRALGFLLGGPLLLLLGCLLLCALVGLEDERLAARPPEDADHKDKGEQDVPGGRDELLRGRVVDGNRLRNIAAAGQREGVRRLGDADRAW